MVMTVNGKGERSSGRETYSAAITALTTNGARPGRDAINCTDEDHLKLICYNQGVVIGFFSLLEAEGFDFTDLTKRSNLQALVRLRMLSYSGVVNRIFEYLLLKGARSRGLVPELHAKLVIQDRLLMMVALADGTRNELNRKYMLTIAKRPGIAKALAMYAAKIFTNQPKNLASDRAENDTMRTIAENIGELSRYRDFCIIFATIWGQQLKYRIVTLAEEYTRFCPKFTTIPGVATARPVVTKNLIEQARMATAASTISWNETITELNEVPNSDFVVEPAPEANLEDGDMGDLAALQAFLDAGPPEALKNLTVQMSNVTLLQDVPFRSSCDSSRDAQEDIGNIQPMNTDSEEGESQTDDEVLTNDSTRTIRDRCSSDTGECQPGVSSPARRGRTLVPVIPNSSPGKRRRDWSHPSYLNLSPIKRWSPTHKRLRSASVTLQSDGYWEKRKYLSSGEQELVVALQPLESPFVRPRKLFQE
ncbi:protein of unknown function [Taphrina deformans PYCC 5710]|uniref:Uncharacterized protein n=1 Tax=Taphrina deformans (strain PYCC 5710 / ATCC 11124 / CBS 356.35 / IMI 108563 / JCM 9778 / NBRC 8474) TaxID=1097556 RepID=R4XDG8_TAPDE|nr:protein of unknown function [Taphrina deformans PYCC 5710]|eukprot:CCG83636.1 protein of unknown function [Taphrina deformans PYCC 5710]